MYLHGNIINMPHVITRYRDFPMTVCSKFLVFLCQFHKDNYAQEYDTIKAYHTSRRYKRLPFVEVIFVKSRNS